MANTVTRIDERTQAIFSLKSLWAFILPIASAVAWFTYLAVSIHNNIIHRLDVNETEHKQIIQKLATVEQQNNNYITKRQFEDGCVYIITETNKTEYIVRNNLRDIMSR